MGYMFRSGISACDPGGSLVLLDVSKDRYFALGAAARETCLRLVAGLSDQPGDTVIIDDLVASDILCRVDQDTRPQFCRPPPTVRMCLRDETAIEFSRSATMSALARQAAAILELRIRPLHAVLAGVARAKHRLSRVTHPPSDPRSIAASFTHADRVMTELDRCLPRSIALARALLAGGVAPDLILGVKLRPFEAHCWVQCGDMLVSDDLGTIMPFTPILVI